MNSRYIKLMNYRNQKWDVIFFIFIKNIYFIYLDKKSHEKFVMKE